jgi:carotenoid 1,2-hydratase
VSDDGGWGIVLIAMLGNPFSPSYARAIRANTRPNPLDHCALNVGVYGRDGAAWALTEQCVHAEDRSASSLQIGQSSMRWEGDQLIVDVREHAPWTRRPITGRVSFRPDFTCDRRFMLDPDRRHAWTPVAPSGRLDVRLDQPNVRFSARGYHDTNAGDEPLANAFSDWTWSRAHVDARSVISYDVALSDGSLQERAISVGPHGVREETGLVSVELPRTRWGLSRTARCSAGHAPRVIRNLEDTPFYARDVIETHVDGRVVRAMHETLSGRRLAMKTVEMLLPFRMRKA